MTSGLRARRGLCAAAFACAVALAASACDRADFGKHYEYDEDITLAVDGSARVRVSASIPALVNLRGMDLDARPTAAVDKAKVRALFASPAARVTRVSRWRRYGRQFVQVRMDVDDITKLGGTPAFSWAAYQFARKDGLIVYRQALGAPAGKDAGAAGWKGDELVSIRVHLPSRIRFHNAGAGNLRRGNILVWEQRLADRQAGKPLEAEARIEETSILYSTLVLFGASALLALAVFGAFLGWIATRGRRRRGR